MKVESEFDFGFAIVSEDEITKEVREISQEEVVEYARQGEKLREMILPLLHNLAAKPESEYIKWPNRTKTINEFITKLFAVSGLKPAEEDLV